MTHIVLLQLKPETTAEQMTQVFRLIQPLATMIPGLLRIDTQKNVSTLHKGYTYGFIMQFASPEALQGYAAHPSYAPVKAELQRLCQGNIVFDYAQATAPWEEFVDSLKNGWQSFMKSWQGSQKKHNAL